MNDDSCRSPAHLFCPFVLDRKVASLVLPDIFNSLGTYRPGLVEEVLKIVRSKEVHFCLPFVRGASSSYICVATVVIRHVETEKPTSCA